MRMELNRNPPQRRKNLNVLKHSPIIKGDVIEELQHPDGKVIMGFDICMVVRIEVCIVYHGSSWCIYLLVLTD